MKTDQSKAMHRKTVGVMAANFSRIWGPEFAAGIFDAAETHDINLIFFIGGKPEEITSVNTAETSFGFYDLAKGDLADGLLFSADMAHGKSAEELKKLRSHFKDFPAAANAIEMDGVVNLVADNIGGMRAAIRHLIQVHGYKRIAFIKGLHGQVDAEQRLLAYQQELQHNAIRYDERLVVKGDFSPESGRAAVKTLLDERKARVDAIVACNDRMAFGALDTLQSRGIRVPGDIALVGFDDVSEARFLGVPLTTVKQSFHETGRQALEILLKRLRDETIPAQRTIQTELVVRWSCGCLPENVKHAWLEAAEVARTGRLENKRDAAIRSLLTATNIADDHPALQSFRVVYGNCWDALLLTLGGEKNSFFLESVEAAISMLQLHHFDATIWHNFVSTLRRYALAGINDKAQALIAENLFQQARLLVGEFSQRTQAYHRLQLEQQEEVLQAFAFSMAPAMSVEEIGKAIEKHFPNLGLKRCYALFYRDVEFPQPVNIPPTDKYRLLFQYDEDGLLIPHERPSIPEGHLLPVGKLPTNRRFSAIVMPLSLAENRFGFLWIEISPQDWEIYMRVRNLVASALLRSMLVEQREIAQHQIERLLEDAKRNAAELAIAKEMADAVAKENAMLYQSEQEQRKMAEELAVASQHLSSLIASEQLSVQIMQELDRLLDYERGWLILQSPSGELEVAASYGIPKNDPQPEIELVVRDGGLFDLLSERLESHLIPDVTRVKGVKTQVKIMPACWLAVPLINKKKVTGMLLLTRPVNYQFEEADQLLAHTYAVQVAVVLENARLIDELNRFNQVMERMVSERVNDYTIAIERLAKLDKNKADFISVSAHELRTPLTVMKGYMGMIRSHPKVQGEELLTQAVDGMLTGADRLHTIVNNMLDAAKLENEIINPHFEQVNLSLLTRLIYKDYAADLTERNLELVLDASLENLPLLRADGELLQKALDNLIVNAIKFTPDGGQIIVRGQTAKDTRLGDCVEIQVQDTGIGIAEENLDLIFEKLYQLGKVELHSSGRTKFKGGGPGLGLAIVAGIVKAHSGRIWAESPGYDEETLPGSTFILRIPLTK